MRWSLFFPFIMTSFIYFISGRILVILILKLFWCCFPICTLLLVNSSSSCGLLTIFLSLNYPQSLWVEICFLLFLSPLPSVFCLHLVLTFLSRFRSCPGSARLPFYSDIEGLDGEKPGLGPKPPSLWLHCQVLQKCLHSGSFGARPEHPTPVLDTESGSSPPSGMEWFFDRRGPAFISDRLAPAVHCVFLSLYVSRPRKWLPYHLNLFQWLYLDQDGELREELSNFTTFPFLMWLYIPLRTLHSSLHVTCSKSFWNWNHCLPFQGKLGECSSERHCGGNPFINTGLTWVNFN